MALNLKYSLALKNAQMDAITSTIGGLAELKFYTGAQPATPDTALGSQTLLASLVGNATFAPAAVAGLTKE